MSAGKIRREVRAGEIDDVACVTKCRGAQFSLVVCDNVLSLYLLDEEWPVYAGKQKGTLRGKLGEF